MLSVVVAVEVLLALVLCRQVMPTQLGLAVWAGLPVICVLSAAHWRGETARLASGAFAGVALAAFSLIAPATWLLALACTAGALWLGRPDLPRRARTSLFGIGAVFPTLLFGAVMCAGEDARQALLGSFPSGLTPTDVLNASGAVPPILDAAAAASKGDWKGALQHLMKAGPSLAPLAEKAIIKAAGQLKADGPEGIARSLLTAVPALLTLSMLNSPGLHVPYQLQYRSPSKYSR